MSFFYNLEFFGLAKYWGGGANAPLPPPPVPTAMPSIGYGITSYIGSTW